MPPSDSRSATDLPVGGTLDFFGPGVFATAPEIRPQMARYRSQGDLLVPHRAPPDKMICQC